MKMIMKQALFGLLLFTVGTAFAEESLSSEMRYSGSMADEAGIPLDGEYLMDFTLSDDSQGGDILWEETQNVIVVKGP